MPVGWPAEEPTAVPIAADPEEQGGDDQDTDQPKPQGPAPLVAADPEEQAPADDNEVEPGQTEQGDPDPAPSAAELADTFPRHPATATR